MQDYLQASFHDLTIFGQKTNIFDLLSHRTGLPLHGMVEEPDYTAGKTNRFFVHRSADMPVLILRGCGGTNATSETIARIS
jgi:hypothetical protein